MTRNDLHPAAMLALLGVMSGSLGATFIGSGYGDAPNPGVYMVLTGLWFGFAMGIAVRHWGNASLSASLMTAFVTWLAWEAAVNVAIQTDREWPASIEIAQTHKSYLTGIVAGSVGAVITWAAAAFAVPTLRRCSAAVAVTVTGALFGLLYPAVNYFDSGLVLLVPWQAAVAAVIGLNMHAPEIAGAQQRRIPAV